MLFGFLITLRVRGGNRKHEEEKSRLEIQSLHVNSVPLLTTVCTGVDAQPYTPYIHFRLHLSEKNIVLYVLTLNTTSPLRNLLHERSLEQGRGTAIGELTSGRSGQYEVF